MSKRIVFQNDDGGVSVIIPADCGLSVEGVAAKDVPAGRDFDIVDTADLPKTRIFRSAWEKNGPSIEVNLLRAKAISHIKRRLARATEMSILDIEATIPAKAVEAEAGRQKIRDKYTALQAEIDAAASVEALLQIVTPMRNEA